MDNLIPSNGRVAIVDDKIDQALPLMRVLSKNNIPFVYYKGDDLDYLPDKPENDIRILFLDLNLLGGRDYQPKEIESTLYSVLSRILSPTNYPYVIILWSRQEKEYKSVLEGLFDNTLKHCAPIAIREWIKSDFFPNFAEEEENTDNEHIILEKLKEELINTPAYSYLLQWENCVHSSADKTIQEVFHDYKSENDWHNHANCILQMFANSYLGKHYNEASLIEKTRASLSFLNDVYYDTLEYCIQNEPFENATSELNHHVNEEEQRMIRSAINESLLISKNVASIRQPGCVFIWEEGDFNAKMASAILNDSINTQQIREQVYKDNSGGCLSSIKKTLSDCIKKTKKTIKSSFLQPCGVVVTPACDYAQNKTKFDRILLGIIINEEYLNELDIKSDAIYVSPVFNYCSQPRIMVLHFRYFRTDNLDSSTGIKSLFRFRSSVLSEIQSKLARHINRQGIMNL